MNLLIVTLFSYIAGSIPFGLILGKIFGKIDIRKIGSGNIGATNVLRTGNKLLAGVTLVLDIVKGYVPVMITMEYFPEFVQLSCLTVFLGHLFPIWLKFKGGKGVATYLGILFALSIQLASLFIFTWVVVSLIFKYSSLSSMFSSLTVLVVAVIKETALSSIGMHANFEKNIILMLFIFFILIIFTHRKNILSLKNKTEQKIKI